jgi:hypothetical protein
VPELTREEQNPKLETYPMNTVSLPASTLTKAQFKVFSKNVGDLRIVCKVRFDDQCGNGHNTFSITGESFIKGRLDTCGCIHELITKHFPNLAPLIKWHLTSTDGPMHYTANTIYHATEHGPTHAWVSGEIVDADTGVKAKYMEYLKIEEANKLSALKPSFEVKVDQKTEKKANLDHARASAVWPEATREQLLNEQILLDRLPALMAEFKKAVEALGFTY